MKTLRSIAILIPALTVVACVSDGLSDGGADASLDNTITTYGANADFSIAVAPVDVTVAQGSTAAATVTTAVVTAPAETISLAVSGMPSGVAGFFNPTTVSTGQSATLTFSASATAATGTTSFTITGLSSAATHTATGTVTVAAADNSGVLSNGVPVTGLSGAQGSQRMFSIVVPADQTQLKVSISGGTGDADLYVRADQPPALATYDCRPFVTGNNETCTFTPPAATTYFIMLHGFAPFSGVTLVAEYFASSAVVLTNNVPVNRLTGSAGSQRFFKLSLPPSRAPAVFQMTGGTGDADLYVRRGAMPTTTTWDCRPFLTGDNETCTMPNASGGDYYVMINGFTAYSGVSLVGHEP